jgi:hypothetical protein
MNNRMMSILLALAWGVHGGLLFAQDEGETAPSVTESGWVTETSPEEASPEPAPDEAVAEEQIPQTTILEKSGDVLVMPEPARGPALPISLPQHGMKMEDVERRYGSPLSREPAVGKPPITRWNYDGFSVFFEHRTVLHAVQKDRPAEIYRKDELLPVSTP